MRQELESQKKRIDREEKRAKDRLAIKDASMREEKQKMAQEMKNMADSARKEGEEKGRQEGLEEGKEEVTKSISILLNSVDGHI